MRSGQVTDWTLEPDVQVRAPGSGRYVRLGAMPRTGDIRVASVDDVEVIGRLLHDFNHEFDEPITPPAAWLAQRMGELLRTTATDVLLPAEGPYGLAVLRYQASIWTAGLEC